LYRFIGAFTHLQSVAHWFKPNEEEL